MEMPQDENTRGTCTGIVESSLKNCFGLYGRFSYHIITIRLERREYEQTL